VFAGPESDGLGLELYQVRDPALLGDVVRQCAMTVLAQPGVRRLELKIYAISKAEHLDTPFFVRVPHKAVTIAN
jgi:hypothetical protein